MQLMQLIAALFGSATLIRVSIEVENLWWLAIPAFSISYWFLVNYKVNSWKSGALAAIVYIFLGRLITHMIVNTWIFSGAFNYFNSVPTGLFYSSYFILISSWPSIIVAFFLTLNLCKNDHANPGFHLINIGLFCLWEFSQHHFLFLTAFSTLQQKELLASTFYLGIPGLRLWFFATAVGITCLLQFPTKSFAAALFATFCVPFVTGAVRLHTYYDQSFENQRFVLIQPNNQLSHGAKGQSQLNADYKKIVEELTERKLQPDDIVVWPESSFLNLPRREENYQWLFSKIQAVGAQQFVGTIRKRIISGKEMVSPSMAYFTPKSYHSEHLKTIPFPIGERAPNNQILSFFNLQPKWSQNQRFGERPQIIRAGSTDHKITVLPIICYEGIPKSYTDELANKSSGQLRVFIQGFNENWFGQSLLNKIHSLAMRVHAARHGIPLVRAGMNSHSQTIDGLGQITHSSQKLGFDIVEAIVQLPVAPVK